MKEWEKIFIKTTISITIMIFALMGAYMVINNVTSNAINAYQTAIESPWG